MSRHRYRLVDGCFEKNSQIVAIIGNVGFSETQFGNSIVGEASDRVNLSFEARARHLRSRVVGGEHLHRDASAGRGVRSQVHGRESAGAEHLVDAVAIVDKRSRGNRGVLRVSHHTQSRTPRPTGQAEQLTSQETVANDSGPTTAGACMPLTSRKSSVALLLFVAALVTACVPEQEEEAVVVVVPSGTNTVSEDDTPMVTTLNNMTPANNEGCVDADGDGYPVGCVDFGDLEPDCDDDDPNNWASCDTCVDADGDGVMGQCDLYDGLVGPDCDDDDPNNWSSCDTCVDTDGDGYFTGCDAYVSIAEDCDDTAATVHPGAPEVPGNGVDDDCDPETPDECTYPANPAVDPEPGHLAGITRMHNLWRWRVGVQPLTWNEELARVSRAYAEACIWGHDQGRSPAAGFQYVGENLYATTVRPSSETVLDSVQAWADERYDFDFGFTTGQTTGGMVGHYTQMVWHSTTEVGCGFARCENGIEGLSWPAGTVVVCRYGPGGNYVGEAPYGYSEGACLDLDNDDVWQGADPDDTDRSQP